ncbi:YdcF family protein [Lampropedia aestuarii]|uniref:YdcF family protein n=1 Tax=Lampropedia aestuarii TaxID=2562762 RepID=UPI002468FAD6|nr:YdcF family protein [Lampropedia aestuarii]MDH5858251.1 YdcF family protein [Lampropedia aestuarii]
MLVYVAQAVGRWPFGAKLLALLATILVLQPLSLLLGRGHTSFGVSFPLAVGLLLWLGLCLRKPLLGWVYARRWRRLLWYGVWLAVLAWLIGLFAFVATLLTASELPESVQGPVAAIIVLGSSTPNAQPSPTTRARLDTAYLVAQRFPQAVVAVSGGVDFGEVLSEGHVMGAYLRQRGLPADQIIQEEASTSTDLNFKLTEPLLASRGISLEDPIVLVTSDFHVWRATRIALRQGWQNVQAVGAATPLYIRYNAWLREYFAVFSSWLLGEI